MLALSLAPFPVIGDAGRDEALRAMRDQAGAIHEWVESAQPPAWLDINPHESARAAGEALARPPRSRRSPHDSAFERYSGRVLVVEDPAAGETKRLAFEYESQGAHLMGLAAAPNNTTGASNSSTDR